MTRSITVRLDDRHVEWLEAQGGTITEAVKSALDRAMREQSYEDAAEILRRIPLDTVDEWGDPEEFMRRAGDDAR